MQIMLDINHFAITRTSGSLLQASHGISTPTLNILATIQTICSPPKINRECMYLHASMVYMLPATQLCSRLQSNRCSLTASMQYNATEAHTCAAASGTVMQPLQHVKEKKLSNMSGRARWQCLMRQAMQDRLTEPDQSSPQSQTAPHPQPQSDSACSKE